MSAPLLDRSIQFDGREVRYGITGEGPAMVILHGTPWSSFNLRHLIEGLSADFQVHYFDLLGYGASDRSPGDVSLGVQNKVLHTLIDHWGLAKPLVVGHDFGGATALRTHLLNNREFERLVLIDAVAVSPWGSSFFRHVHQYEAAFAGLPDYLQEVLVRRYIQSAAYQPLSEYVLAHTASPWLGPKGKPALYRQMAQADQRYTDEVEHRYSKINMPVLVLWGEKDVWIPVEQGRKLAEAIPAARFVPIPDTGHLVIEEAPGTLLREIRAFCRD
ncbi:MAG: alpha/beta fold hydrolase [Verrucomicrobia bacterium]|jgi:pimeloyl-ACP methyl ester carboxylesterase|nr:alpha/beta fold hydrolase [Verrucomicrobiota bacterium]